MKINMTNFSFFLLATLIFSLGHSSCFAQEWEVNQQRKFAFENRKGTMLEGYQSAAEERRQADKATIAVLEEIRDALKDIKIEIQAVHAILKDLEVKKENASQDSAETQVLHANPKAK